MKCRVWSIWAVILCLLVPFAAAAEEGTAQGGWDYPVLYTSLDTPLVALVNSDHPLTEADVPDNLTPVVVRTASSSGFQLQQEASNALTSMFNNALVDNVMLYGIAGYRNFTAQGTLYENNVARNGGTGDGTVAKAGESDNQTGLGVDIGSVTYLGKRMDVAFGETAEGKWLAKHCGQYGFILRYPAEGEAETGMAYQPWHFRYVGVMAATYITDNGMTLEGFTEEWQAYLADYLAAGNTEADATAYAQSVGVEAPPAELKPVEESVKRIITVQDEGDNTQTDVEFTISDSVPYTKDREMDEIEVGVGRDGDTDVSLYHD